MPGVPNTEAMDTTADSYQAPPRFKPVGGLDGTSDPSSQTVPPAKTAPASSGGLSLKGGLKGPAVPKRRMRAEDMFGDSDED